MQDFKLHLLPCCLTHCFNNSPHKILSQYPFVYWKFGQFLSANSKWMLLMSFLIDVSCLFNWSANNFMEISSVSYIFNGIVLYHVSNSPYAENELLLSFRYFCCGSLVILPLFWHHLLNWTEIDSTEHESLCTILNYYFNICLNPLNCVSFLLLFTDIRLLNFLVVCTSLLEYSQNLQRPIPLKQIVLPYFLDIFCKNGSLKVRVELHKFKNMAWFFKLNGSYWSNSILSTYSILSDTK